MDPGRETGVKLLAHVRSARTDLADLEAALAALPILLDRQLPFRHWSREALSSDRAREGWLEPDMDPLGI